MHRLTADTGALGEAIVFLSYFEGFPDPRQRGKVVYPFDEILLLCLLAVLAGAETFVDIARFGEKKIDLLRRFRPFRDGTPSHDHLGDIFASLDAEEFQRRFVAWVAAQTGTLSGGDRHRRQDAATLLPEERRQSADPHGFGVCGASAPRARTGQGGGQVERDRRHPCAARHDGDRGGHRDHRCDRLPAQYRRENPGQESRLRARAQRQSRLAARGCRGLRC